jgi:hypothetical protein
MVNLADIIEFDAQKLWKSRLERRIAQSSAPGKITIFCGHAEEVVMADR